MREGGGGGGGEGGEVGELEAMEGDVMERCTLGTQVSTEFSCKRLPFFFWQDIFCSGPAIVR